MYLHVSKRATYQSQLHDIVVALCTHYPSQCPQHIAITVPRQPFTVNIICHTKRATYLSQPHAINMHSLHACTSINPSIPSTYRRQPFKVNDINVTQNGQAICLTSGNLLVSITCSHAMHTLSITICLQHIALTVHRQPFKVTFICHAKRATYQSQLHRNNCPQATLQGKSYLSKKATYICSTYMSIHACTIPFTTGLQGVDDIYHTKRATFVSTPIGQTTFLCQLQTVTPSIPTFTEPLYTVTCL